MAYAEITIADRNRIKRWLQRQRFSVALAILQRAELVGRPRILDFGAGNGELVRQLVSVASIEAWLFEPTPSLMAEARDNLAGCGSVVFLESLESVRPQTFDCVFCLEVFEHLPRKETLQALARIHRVLKDDAFAVIGVPHELFLPALLKGLFRMSRRYGDFDARPGQILRSFWGRPPAQRPLAEISPGLRYHFHHLGFDYRALQGLLREQFQVVETKFTPFPILGAALNSEVYFLLKKARPSLAAGAPKVARH